MINTLSIVKSQVTSTCGLLKNNMIDKCYSAIRVKSGNFGHQVNSDIQWQTVEILMRRFFMSRLIRISTVCLVNIF